MRENHSGTLGWILLGVVIAGWDILAPETLSSAYWRGLQQKNTRPAVLAGTVYVLSHLLLKKPRKILVYY